MDQLALDRCADLNKRVSMDGGLLHWHRVIHPAASPSPGCSLIMARIPTHWIPLGNTASDKASYYGRMTGVKLLLEYGANVDARSKWGWTASHTAASKGHLEIM